MSAKNQAMSGSIVNHAATNYKPPEVDKCLFCGEAFHPTAQFPVFCSIECDLAYFGRPNGSIRKEKKLSRKRGGETQ